MRDLHADEVPRPRGRSPARESRHGAVIGEQDPAVPVRLRVRHECERRERAAPLVCLLERGQRQVGQRVAVDDQERLGADDVERLPWSAGRPEDIRLLPRVARPHAQVAPVADDGGERVGEVVQVQHDLSDAGGGKPSHDAPDHRLASHGDCRLAADRGERPQARPEPGAQKQRVCIDGIGVSAG